MKRIICVVLYLLFSTQALQAQMKPVKSGIYRWNEHEVEAGSDRETRRILEGVSPHFDYLEIHATTQQIGAKKKPAHASEDSEELILVQEGLLKVNIGDHSEIVGAGSVVSLMPLESHTLENVGDVPLTYFVIKYRAKSPPDFERAAAGGGSLLLNVNDLPLKPSSRGGSRRYFDRGTAMCERLELHVTQLHRQGPSHEPHMHGESEVILVISGETSMMIDGKNYRGTAGDLYFVASDLNHGVGNATESPCSYFALKWK